MRHKYHVRITDERGFKVGANTWAPNEDAAKEQVIQRIGAKEANNPEVTHLKDDCCPCEMSDAAYEAMVDEYSSLCKED